MSCNYCPYCMSPVLHGAKCPNCGREPAGYQPAGYHLPPEYLLQGRYLVGRVLDEDCFGLTYLCLDKAVGQRVAVREYFPSSQVHRDSSDTLYVSCLRRTGEIRYKRSRERFLKEAEALIRFCQLPPVPRGVVRALEAFSANNTAYAVSEYPDGRPLSSVLGLGGSIPGDKLFSMIDPVIWAMCFEHRAGVIHRRICPENIVVLENGQLKLGNFGLGWDYTDEDAGGAAHHGFAPLEQYLGHYPGEWTDVYALSATLYRCLTGRVPPTATERIAAGMDHLAIPIKWGEDTPQSARNALYKGLALHARDRWKTIMDFYDELYDTWIVGNNEDPYATAQTPERPRSKFPLPIQPCSLAAGLGLLVGLRPDGTVLAAGRTQSFDLRGFDHVAAVSAGEEYLSALRGDGTVLVAKRDGGSFLMEGWHDIVAVALGGHACPFIVGLRSDGRALSYVFPNKRNETDNKVARRNCDVSSWTEIVAIAASSTLTVGLRADGTVLAAGRIKEDMHNYHTWRDIISVGAGMTHIAGLRADGKVLADDGSGEPSHACQTGAWEGVKAIAVGDFHSVGLSAEHLWTVGEVKMYYPPSKNGFEHWDNIVSITAGGMHTSALCADGTVLTTNPALRDVVSLWRLWVPEQLLK